MSVIKFIPKNWYAFPQICSRNWFILENAYDSIDSDVLLIAALFVSRNIFQGNPYVCRYKTRLAPDSKKRKVTEDDAMCTIEKRRLEYETIHVNVLLQVLHARMQDALVQQSSSLADARQFTAMLQIYSLSLIGQ